MIASGATLLIVNLGNDAMRTLKSTALLGSHRAETISTSIEPTPLDQLALSPTKNTGPKTVSNPHEQSRHPSLNGHARQVSFAAESNIAAETQASRPKRPSPQDYTYQVTSFPAIEPPEVPQPSQQQVNSQQPVAPARTIPNYPPSRRLARVEKPLASEAYSETTVQSAEPVLAQQTSSNLPETTELVKENPEQGSGESFSVLQTNFETRILKPGSVMSAPHLATQIRFSKQGLSSSQSGVENAAWLDQSSASSGEPTPAIRAVRQSKLPRQRVNPQVEARAKKRIQYGESLSRRRSFYAAREEFILALLLITNSHETDSTHHAYADRLTQALTAMDEINDFSAMRNSGGYDHRFQQTIHSHKTQLFAGADLTTISPRKAIDLYCGFAQSRIEQAIGFSVAGSEALHALGKLESMTPNANPQNASTSQSKAIVFYRAALSVNPANALCANDLGVLLFNMGRLNEAEEALRLSLEPVQSRLVWRNLASVHKQQASLATSGDQRNYQLRLAQMAEREAQKFQSDPRERGLANNQWATTSDFQHNAAFPDTVVQRASGNTSEDAQPQGVRVKAVSFLQKVTGRN